MGGAVVSVILQPLSSALITDQCNTDLLDTRKAPGGQSLFIIFKAAVMRRAGHVDFYGGSPINSGQWLTGQCIYNLLCSQFATVGRLPSISPS